MICKQLNTQTPVEHLGQQVSSINQPEPPEQFENLVERVNRMDENTNGIIQGKFNDDASQTIM